MCARSSAGTLSPSLWRCRDSMGEVKRVPENDDGGKEVQAGYAEMLALQCHLALIRNRPVQGQGGHDGHRVIRSAKPVFAPGKVVIGLEV